MAFLPYRLCFLTLLHFLIIHQALAHDFSILGYSPDDLLSEDNLHGLFKSWMSKNGKFYNSIEDTLHRFETFKSNLKHIDERNKEISSYWLGLNEFADLSHEEFKGRYLGLKAKQLPKRTLTQDFKYGELSEDSELPKSVDWREKGAVTPVKNQGSCGSCWAFSTVAAVEGLNQIVTGNLTTLSEQELIDCDTAYNNGCNGGLMDYAFEFITSNGGLHKEDDYPYIMDEGTCEQRKGEKQMITIGGYQDVPANDEQSLLKALSQQPVSIAIDASGRDFQFYSGGVYDGSCGTDLDHGVAAVGYGSTTRTDYIIVKNSWGETWGERGYIHMKRSTGKPEGLCGINKLASYPINKDYCIPQLLSLSETGLASMFKIKLLR